MMMHSEQQRGLMVDQQIAARGVRDPLVLEAMRAVPREAFVSPDLAEFAYGDAPLPIGEGQTISQPYMVALMIEALRLRGGERVLDVGTGSGYAAAILSRIASRVYSVERHQCLADLARRRLEWLGYDTIEVLCGDGTLGWPEHAPYDGIVVGASGPEIPPALRQQLVLGGRLVMPVGDSAHHQCLVRETRTGPDRFDREHLGEVRFVPLIGAEGW